MKIEVSKQIYSKEVLLKTAYSFIEKAYLHLSQNDESWVISWTDKPNCRSDCQDFENELISQQLRENLLQKTADIRKLVLARAFASTVVEENPDTNLSAEDLKETDSEDSDILKGWFNA